MAELDQSSRSAVLRQTIDAALADCLAETGEAQAQVVEAMRYSVLSGGKRLRPALLLEARRLLDGGPLEPALPAACAVEFIHASSLIHDDLPAMDDDDLRRGLPTCHKQFGEAIAILAGDSLLIAAFELLSHGLVEAGVPAAVAVEVAGIVARAAGWRGMVGGQVADMLAESERATADQVLWIHHHKTGALITAAVEAGAVLGGADPPARQRLVEFGSHLGLAFQIQDDLLEVTGVTEELGKSADSDDRQRKATLPAVIGVEAARRQAEAAVEQAVSCIEPWGEAAAPLRELAGFVTARTH